MGSSAAAVTLSDFPVVECLANNFSPYWVFDNFTCCTDTRLRVNVARIYEMLDLKGNRTKMNDCNEVGLVDLLTKEGALSAKQLEVLWRAKLLIYRFNSNIINNVQNGKLCCV